MSMDFPSNSEQISDPSAALAGLLGQLAWGVRRGYGSFLTIEFGEPRLFVREPIQSVSSDSLDIRQRLSRRHVSVHGIWHLWITHGSWTLVTVNYATSSEESEAAKVEPALTQLDGQRLVSAKFNRSSAEIHLSFDLGAHLRIGPGQQVDRDEDQWQLFAPDGSIVNCDQIGRIALVSGKQPR
ncbi:MAG: hypothetical protein JOY71_19690 [Acetobacteraceae bacterium]|nr:hypothetical protein [Acetobacteraceae bacterium]